MNQIKKLIDKGASSQEWKEALSQNPDWVESLKSYQDRSFNNIYQILMLKASKDHTRRTALHNIFSCFVEYQIPMFTTNNKNESPADTAERLALFPVLPLLREQERKESQILYANQQSQELEEYLALLESED